MKDAKERTMSRVNKESKLFGLPFYIIFIMGALILIGIMIANFYSLFLTIPICIKIQKKLNKATKEGCPDYVTTTVNGLSVPKKIEDNRNLFSKL